MNRKQMISIGVGAVGVLLILMAFNGMGKLSKAERVLGEAKQALTGHPMGSKLDSFMDSEMSIAGKKVKTALFGGLLLVVVGAGGFYYYRKG